MTASRFRQLDVRPLLAAGEEPLPRILTEIAALKPGQGLTVIAPFLPAPLIEKLKSEGFQARVERIAGGAWAADFWRD